MARAGGLVSASAYSAMEQALRDLAAKSLDVPACAFFGGAVRDTLPVYANINRATKVRTPAGFAATARKAVADGFHALKAAPFDGFPSRAHPRDLRRGGSRDRLYGDPMRRGGVKRRIDGRLP
jgi:L-alanine-DL-glutamate epimerase-like enolase superfamily enzyme